MLPSRRLEPSLTASEVLSRLSNVSAGTLVSVDIEGGVPNPEETTHRNLDGVTCIGISTDPSNAFTINLETIDDNTKGIVMREFNKLMSNPVTIFLR